MSNVQVVEGVEVVERVAWEIVDGTGQRRRLELAKFISIRDRRSGKVGYDWMVAAGGTSMKARTLEELKEDILRHYGGQEAPAAVSN